VKKNYLNQFKNKFAVLLFLFALNAIWAGNKSFESITENSVPENIFVETSEKNDITFVATFINKGNEHVFLSRSLSDDRLDSTIKMAPGESVSQSVANGETWQVINEHDALLIGKWEMDCSKEDFQYSFGTVATSESDCDVCQSHGNHDHVSGWKLRYVGPDSPALIEFETDGYSNTTYSGTHSFDDIIIIEAEDRFGTNSEFTINGVSFDTHTSCSQPTNVGMGITNDDDFVTNPNPNDPDIMFIIEDIATAEDGWCGDTISNPPNNGCVATFVNEGNVTGVLWRLQGGSWDNQTFMDPGASVTKNVVDGETWEIWNTADTDLITQWTIDCSNGDPTYTFGSNSPPEDCDVCQSHGDHDHVSAFYLRYVGPVSPANVQFESEWEGEVTSYNGTLSYGDYFLIQANDRFGTNSQFTVNGNSFDSHTSCSQPTEVGMGITNNDNFVTNPNPNDPNIMFIIEGISTAEDGSCGTFEPPTPPSTSLGDKVFLDIDQDGIQDLGENGVSGVTVDLLDCNGNQISTTITDGNGNYLFSDLDSDINYIVEFIPPINFFLSPSNQGGNDSLDSDAGSNGRTACIDLAPNEYNQTIDAGIYDPTVPPPPEDCDVCQSHGDHDHVSAFYLRYVGPVSPANVQFETNWEGEVTS
jgi:hypothetical protein